MVADVTGVRVRVCVRASVQACVGVLGVGGGSVRLVMNAETVWFLLVGEPLPQRLS